MLIQIILIAVMTAALVTTWSRYRQGIISIVEALTWSALWIAVGVVAGLPDTSSRVAEFFGVGRGADLVVYASVLVLFLLVFKLFIKLEKIDRHLTDLVRRDALRDLEKKHE